jgi:hypothetical protein
MATTKCSSAEQEYASDNSHLLALGLLPPMLLICFARQPARAEQLPIKTHTTADGLARDGTYWRATLAYKFSRPFAKFDVV